MSLFKKWKVGEKGCVGLWHITESMEQLLKEAHLTEEEIKVLNTFSYEHRKKEWLSARILTRQLSSQEKTRIIYDSHNKPFLQGSHTQISLSHSHDMMAVTLSGSSTGIDIEQIKDKVVRIRHKFMNQTELDSIQLKQEAEQLTVYWCAKESLYKLYGKKELAFKENLHIDPFLYSEKGQITGSIRTANINSSYLLNYEKLHCAGENYMLAYVVNKD